MIVPPQKLRYLIAYRYDCSSFDMSVHGQCLTAPHCLISPLSLSCHTPGKGSGTVRVKVIVLEFNDPEKGRVHPPDRNI